MGRVAESADLKPRGEAEKFITPVFASRQSNAVEIMVY